MSMDGIDYSEARSIITEVARGATIQNVGGCYVLLDRFGNEVDDVTRHVDQETIGEAES